MEESIGKYCYKIYELIKKRDPILIYVAEEIKKYEVAKKKPSEILLFLLKHLLDQLENNYSLDRQNIVFSVNAAIEMINIETITISYYSGKVISLFEEDEKTISFLEDDEKTTSFLEDDEKTTSFLEKINKEKRNKERNRKKKERNKKKKTKFWNMSVMFSFVNYFLKIIIRRRIIRMP